MTRVQEYRRRAFECRAMAVAASVPEVRAVYEELAAIWDDMAQKQIPSSFAPDLAKSA